MAQNEAANSYVYPILSMSDGADILGSCLASPTSRIMQFMHNKLILGEASKARLVCKRSKCHILGLEGQIWSKLM